MGKSSKPVIGYHYRPAFQHGLTIGPIDVFLEFRGGDKTAWQGELTASGTISINAPKLWGGEKDQGGIVGDVDIMFGEPGQLPNPYLVSVFGDKTAAWRGFTTVVFKGGRYGAMNPYPQKASYKIRQILQGWDGDCWYPEKAVIDYGGGSTTVSAGQFAVSAGAIVRNEENEYGPFGIDFVGTAQEIADHCVEVRNDATGSSFALGGVPQLSAAGSIIASLATNSAIGLAGVPVTRVCANPGAVATIEGDNGPLGTQNPQVVCTLSFGGLKAINPAHVLYYARTNSDMGREPTSNINEASLKAAADTLHAEGFGICPKWDPAAESVEEFEKRICKLIGGSFTRSLEDGQWYLDLARADYVLEDLPILTDDDILDFKEQPSVLDSAVNSVSVRYFDPEKKETIVTPPARALALVAAFGTIHQTNDYPEIPVAGLAARVGERDALTSATPTRAFDLVTTRKTYAWRPNQRFRLQAPKRGIADMVCMVGDRQTGSLKSGAIRLKAAQDIYSLPSTSFVAVEPGVDTTPPQTPMAISLQRAIEAPYVEVVGSMTRAELDALPADVGFAMAVAAAPAGELDYTMMAAAGGDYAEAGNGEWAATATIVETAGRGDTNFTLADDALLDQVEVGMGALWDGEIVRVDAIDAAAKTITLGRACADTVPAGHAAGSRLWFYQVGFAYDPTEYTDGEAIDVKLLSNTGSQQLPLASATAMALTFDQRLARPYPPGKVRIAGAAWPAEVAGEFIVTWAHRDRVLQADQLLDTEAASVGPEPGVRYALQLIDDATDAVLVEKLDIAGATAAVNLAASGTVRLVLYALNDVAESWQRHEHTFAYNSTGGSDSITADSYAAPVWVIDGNGS